MGIRVSGYQTRHGYYREEGVNKILGAIWEWKDEAKRPFSLSHFTKPNRRALWKSVDESRVVIRRLDTEKLVDARGHSKHIFLVSAMICPMVKETAYSCSQINCPAILAEET